MNVCYYYAYEWFDVCLYEKEKSLDMGFLIILKCEMFELGIDVGWASCRRTLF
jgi:hypothetical protein